MISRSKLQKLYLCEISEPFVYCNRVENLKYVYVILEAKFEKKKKTIGRRSDHEGRQG